MAEGLAYTVFRSKRLGEGGSKGGRGGWRREGNGGEPVRLWIHRREISCGAA